MNKKLPILVVDDEVEMRIALSATLKRCDFEVELSHNAIDAIRKIKKNQYCLVLTDMTMPKRSGVQLLKDIKEIMPSLPVIIMTAHGTIKSAVESMKYGAFDYILKPFKFDVVVFLVERALAQKRLPIADGNNIANNTADRTVDSNIDNNLSSAGQQTTPSSHNTPKDPTDRFAYRQIITKDPNMIALLDLSKSVANSKSTILIEAESGTGKELLAEFIHKSSDRANMPFVALNCAALPESLLESELFGHKKGAFTGAIRDHKGKFEQANKGTILLDEITEMAPALQAKLLRVLQEHKIDKVGGLDPIKVDVRVIATTNRNILEHVKSGHFREDLYFRLNVIPLSLPPLRERSADIILLANHFIKKHSTINKIPPLPLEKETTDILSAYHWQGNVRELENVMERASLLSVNQKNILPNHLLMTKFQITSPNQTSASLGSLINDRSSDKKK